MRRRVTPGICPGANPARTRHQCVRRIAISVRSSIGALPSAKACNSCRQSEIIESGARLSVVVQKLRQPVSSILVAGSIQTFRKPIGVEKQRVAFVHLNSTDRKTLAAKNAHRQTRRLDAGDSCLPEPTTAAGGRRCRFPLRHWYLPGRKPASRIASARVLSQKTRLARSTICSSGRLIEISVRNIACRWAISIEAATPLPETSPSTK